MKILRYLILGPVFLVFLPFLVVIDLLTVGIILVSTYDKLADCDMFWCKLYAFIFLGIGENK